MPEWLGLVMVEVALSRHGSVLRRRKAAKSIRGRAFDVGLGLTALLLLAPIMMLVALAIYIEDGGPILYWQSRLGYGGRSFRCFKFRSMCVDADARLESLLRSSPAARIEWARDHKLKADPRITLIGGFLRKYSLDELPQLLNVLMGDMGLVGPRPIIQAEVCRYGRRFRDYCAVRPGLTGLWQVSGRSDASYRSRVAMDVIYSRRRGPALDLRILAATVPVVLFGRGSY